jgi:HAD superfamily hydrolase (TIGR01549 family)
MNASPLTCVVFDFDGVLVQSNAIKRAAYDHALRGLSVSSMTIDQCLAGTDGDRTDIIDAIVRTLKLPAEEHAMIVSRSVQAYGEHCDALLPQCAETDHASETLAQLVERYPLYVNSATPEETLRRYIERRGWTTFFRGVYGRPHTKVEIFARIARAERIDPERILFVGDRRSDRDAARAAGCHFVGLRSDGCDFEADTELLEALRDLSGYIARATVQC